MVLRKVRRTNFRKSRRPTAKKAVRMVRRLKREVEGDKKFADSQYANSSQSSTAVISHPTNVTLFGNLPGATSNAVATASYYHLAKSIQFRGNVYSYVTPGGLYEDPSFVRFMVIMDKEVNSAGTQPVAADILQYPTDINSPLNLSNCKRFKVLIDKTYGVGSSPSQIAFKHYKKLHHRCGSGSSGGTNFVRENHLYVLTMSDTVALEPSISWTCRYRYCDT